MSLFTYWLLFDAKVYYKEKTPYLLLLILIFVLRLLNCNYIIQIIWQNKFAFCHFDRHLYISAGGEYNLFIYSFVLLPLFYKFSIFTEGCHTIKTVCENPYCLEEVATLLEKEARGVENWLHFAWKFDVPREICESLKPKETPSPTRALMEHIIQDKPNMTVKTFMKALMKIQRTDVVNALLKRLSW